jgi:hypothetical protein
MIAIDLGVRNVDELLRVVKALGSHRYVAGRLHLAHAFAIASVGDDGGGTLSEARAWALATMKRGGEGLDLSSRDERLWRRCTDAEIGALFEAYWAPGPRALAARTALGAALDRHGLPLSEDAPFDEAAEERIHPLAVDAGWELLALRELDPERHKGAIAAFGDPLAFASALFEEESAIPPVPTLYELPAVGPNELLRGADDDGTLAQPFVVWAAGDETYLDYVFRGIRRAARLELLP